MFKQNKGENSVKHNDELFNYMLKGNQGEHHLRSILHTTKELHGNHNHDSRDKRPCLSM